MSGHTVTWIHDGDYIDGRLQCSEPEFAPCRTSCAHGCESWGEVAADGRTHLTDNDVVHEMTPHAYCNIVECIVNGGAIAEFYDGPNAPVHDGPITATWDGDTYLWSYADIPAAKPICVCAMEGPCLGVPGETEGCDACLALDPEHNCLALLPLQSAVT